VSSRDATIVVYAALAFILLLLEMVARLGAAGIPTAAVVLHRLMRRRASQLALLLAWWWLGWHFMLAL
jgi:hypothetical protein